MDSEYLVKLALQHLGLNQKDLAEKLGVSPTQITKWKKGEFMSVEMENRFRSLLEISDLDPEVILIAGSTEDASKWESLINFLASEAQEVAETGYDTEPLNNDHNFLTSEVFRCFKAMGVEIPRPFPTELDFDYESIQGDSPEEIEKTEALLHEKPYSSTIYSAFKCLNDLYGFYAAYIAELEDEDVLELMNTDAENIEPCLVRLAFAKLDVPRKFAPEFSRFRYETLGDYERWINVLKSKAWEAGIPIREELMRLVTSHHDEIGDAAERESLGFNSKQIHPDIYMNELLVGMRVIHQVLPAIMKKLDIEDFELDESELRAQ